MVATPGNSINLTGTAGIVLFDGTSSVTTTAPTNHGAMIGTGTNSINTVAPSTSGNILTSNGTDWTSAVPIVQVASVTLTSAQIKALHGTPIQFIAAPGVGKVNCLLNVWARFTYGGTNVFVAGSAQTVDLYYGTSVQATEFTTIDHATLVGTTTIINQVGYLISQDNTPAQVENIAINAYNNVVTEISGNAGNNNTIIITATYWIATI